MDVLRSIGKLSVGYREELVGHLMLSPDNTVVAFQYAPKWLAEGFSVSPLELPLKSDVFMAPRKPFYGNFGIFEDSMPDGYGRYLLNRMLKAQGIDDFTLDPLQRLSIVGKAGMGALTYMPVTKMGENVLFPELDDMQQMALDVLSEKTLEGADVLYFNSGNSGGCRPKCLLRDADGEWLVKFRHTYDSQDIGIREYECMMLAKRCGVDVPDCKLLQDKYFASRRFDKNADGQRLHVATAAALLSVSINPPMMDYKTLLHLTGYLTQSHSAVEEMFRRMVFNVLIENKDDHAKNFSFICDDGIWRLAPAYDLLPFPEGYHGQHATSVLHHGNPTDEDMLLVGESVRIGRSRGKQVIAEMRDIIRSS